MPALILYLLKANGVLLLFCAGYWLVLHRFTFYTLNRWYLLFALGFAAAYPLVDVGAWLARPAAVATLVPDETWARLPATPAAAFPYWAALVWSYWVGVGLLGLRLVGQLVALYRIRRASAPAQWQGQPYRRVGVAVAPFSFAGTIYLNPAQHAAAELPAILRHEQVHVHQWHTVDVLLAQLGQALCWFNPGAWLLRRAVQQNLEFIADRAVLRAGVLDAKAYQYSLLRLSTLASGAALATHFTFLTLKTRIAMMNRKRSAAAWLGLYAALVPGLVLVALACAPQTEPIEYGAAATAAAYPLRDSTLFFVDGKPSSRAAMQATPNEGISMGRGKSGGAIQKQYGSGVKEIHLVVTKKGQSSKAVSVFRQKQGFESPAEMEKLRAEWARKAADEKERTEARDNERKQLPEALYILDGVPVGKEEVNQLNTAAIRSVQVVKGKQAIEQYGENGRNAVVLISTKNL